MQRQCRILLFRELARNVRDLILGFLVLEFQDSGGGAGRVGFSDRLRGALFVFGGLLGGLWGGVDVGVLVPGGVGGGDDGVPDYCFGARGGGVAGGGGVGGGDVAEDLLCVPVEEGG